MKNYLLIIIALVFFSPNIFAQNLFGGMVIEEQAFVYAEASDTSAIVDTLHFGDCRFFEEVKIWSGYSNYVKIIENGIVEGWINHNNICLTDKLFFNVYEGDSVYESGTSKKLNTILSADGVASVNYFNRVENEFYFRLNLFTGGNGYVTGVIKKTGSEINKESIFQEMFQQYSGKANSILNHEPKIDYVKLNRIVKYLSENSDSTILYLSKYDYNPKFDYMHKESYLNYLETKILFLSENYGSTIPKYDEIIENYPEKHMFGGKAELWAILKKAEVYSDYLNDTTKSVEFYQLLVKEFKYEESSFLHYTTYGREAAHRIINLLKNNPSKLKEESQKISYNSEDLIFNLIGRYGVLCSQFDNYTPDELINFAMQWIPYYFDFIKADFIAKGYYFSYIELLFDKFENDSNFDAYFKYAERLKEYKSDAYILELTEVKKIQLMDKLDYSKSDVIEKLNKIIYTNLNDFIDFYNNRKIIGYNPYWRLLDIKDIPRQNAVLNQSAQLRIGCNDSFPIVKDLKKGENVSIQYYDDYYEYGYVGNGKTKVKLLDGTIGWVDGDFLDLKSSQIFESKAEDELWSHYYANSRNNPYFKDPEINNIELEQIIKGYGINRFPSFGYFDDDDILDFIGWRGYNNSFIVNGKNHKAVLEIPNYWNNFIIARNRLINPYFIKDVNNEEILWKVDGTDSYVNPLVNNDNLYTGYSDSIYSVNVDNGKINWSLKTEEKENCQPVAVDDEKVIYKSSNGLSCRSVKNGDLLWATKVSTNGSQYLLDEDKLFFVNSISREMTDTLLCLTTTSGEILWDHKFTTLSSRRMNNLVADEDYIYFAQNRLYKIDKNNGQIIWEVNPNTWINSMFCVRNSLYINNEGSNNTFISYNKNSGKENWRYSTKMQKHGARLYYQSGKLFYHGDDGILVFRDSLANGLPGGFSKNAILHPNYPNPFNNFTTIQFEIKEDADVKVVVYNSIGEQIKVIAEDFMPMGKYEFYWDGTNDSNSQVASGVYYCSLITNKYVKSKGMVLLK